MAAVWVGRVRELTGDQGDPRIDDVRGRLSHHEASVVATYLRSGHGLIDVMEVTPDVVDGARVSESASVLGDGRWIWREDLAHYVEKYRIALDSQFLESIGTRVPDLSPNELGQFIEDAMRIWQTG